MDTIPQKSLAFLRELRENNNREWFKKRKPEFQIIYGEMKAFFSDIAGLLQKHDDIAIWRPYRIYRDVHFSKDKTPFKRFYAAEYNRRKPALRGGYYIHIEPDDRSFIETGFFGPNADDLKRVRKEWDLSDEIIDVLSGRGIKKSWGNMIGERLKTAPLGFDRNNPRIDLINHKQWIFRHEFKDTEILSRGFASTVDKHFQDIRPFLNYMSDILTTDLNGETLLK